MSPATPAGAALARAEAVAVGPDGGATMTYSVKVANHTGGAGTSGPIDVRMDLPGGVRPAGGARVTVDDPAGVDGMASGHPEAQVIDALGPDGGAITLARGVTLAVGETRTFTLAVPVRADLPAGAPAWEDAGACAAAQVFMVGDATPGDDAACVPFERPEPVTFTVVGGGAGNDRGVSNGASSGNAGVPADTPLVLLSATPSGNPDPRAIVGRGTAGNLTATLGPGIYYLVEYDGNGPMPLSRAIGVDIAGGAEAYMIRVIGAPGGGKTGAPAAAGALGGVAVATGPHEVGLRLNSIG